MHLPDSHPNYSVEKGRGRKEGKGCERVGKGNGREGKSGK